VVHLIVSDGKLDSEADLVIVSTRNSAPVADAGPDQSITLGDLSITLHSSNSHDVDGQTLIYRWAILSAPDGSTAEINPDNTAEPGFKPELPGLYIMQLIVNDGEQDSGPDTLQITVASPPPPPNQAPKITTSPDITGTVGQLYTYDVDATDPDISDILGYSLQVAAPGMLIVSSAVSFPGRPPKPATSTSPPRFRTRAACPIPRTTPSKSAPLRPLTGRRKSPPPRSPRPRSASFTAMMSTPPTRMAMRSAIH
jgi:hypothetical protein